MFKEHPVLIDKFLEEAREIDVDAICDGEEIYIARNLCSTLRKQEFIPETLILPPVSINREEFR